MHVGTLAFFHHPSFALTEQQGFECQLCNSLVRCGCIEWGCVGRSACADYSDQTMLTATTCVWVDVGRRSSYVSGLNVDCTSDDAARVSNSLLMKARVPTSMLDI